MATSLDQLAILRAVTRQFARIRSLALVPALAWIGVLGCKQEDPTVAAKDYPKQMAFSYCEAVYSCECDDYPYSNFNECFAEISADYDAVNNEAYLAGLSYDGSCPAKEVDQIEALACKSWLPDPVVEVCIPPCYAWHGPLPAGSLCEVVASSAEVGVAFSACAQGLTCVGGVCVNPCQVTSGLPKIGEACPDLVCEAGAMCDENQICVALPELPGPGETCQNGACDPDTAVCIADANVCAALPTIGQPCVEGQCDKNSYCSIDDVCLARPALACGLLGGGVPGDGDGDPTGDGDGDPTGDGDGDPTTGDGDGDGDGDPTTGDGDGDPIGQCGWNPAGEGYYCGYDGADPSGVFPYDCPPGLVEGGNCGSVPGAGCCDAEGNNWYCGDDGTSEYLVLEVCG